MVYIRTEYELSVGCRRYKGFCVGSIDRNEGNERFYF